MARRLAGLRKLVADLTGMSPASVTGWEAGLTAQPSHSGKLVSADRPRFFAGGSLRVEATLPFAAFNPQVAQDEAELTTNSSRRSPDSSRGH